MAPSVSKEELMRNSDHLVWGLSGTNSSPDNEPQRFCEKIWVFLNSRTCNIVVVFLVIVEGLVILSELLITLDVIRDPNWKPLIPPNLTQNNTLFLPAVYNSGHSPKLKIASIVLSCTSIIILTIFLIEILLRMLSGKFRYIVQGVEIFDAMIVVVVFSLDLAFLTSLTKRSAREASVLLILLRLWRLHRVMRSITDAAKVEMGYVVNTYQREKFQAEHKVDILILKVEDLEHEVAYLKEKLKKTEKESVLIKKRRSKEGGSLGSHSKSSTATVAVETLPLTIYPSTGTQTFEEHDNSYTSFFLQGIPESVHILADEMASHILEGVFDMYPHYPSTPSANTTIATVNLAQTPKSKSNNKVRRRPDGSLESGYGSGASNINWDRIRAHIRSDQRQSVVSPGGHLGLKCPESSPESGYGSSASALHPRTNSTSPVDTDISSGSAKHADTVFLFPDPHHGAGSGAGGGPSKIGDVAEVELEWLDEQSEIERVKRIEFDPNQHDKGVPMTSL